MSEEQELYVEARRVFGKREMLWNIQRQILAAKQKGKTIDEEWLIEILNGIEFMQGIEEENWNVKQYLDSELERDIIRDSIIIQIGLRIKE